MADEYIQTIDKIKTLLRDDYLNASQLVGLFNEYGVKISNSKLSRSLTDGVFAVHGFDETVRPIVLAVEDLIHRAAPLRIDFSDPAHIRTILSLLDIGIDLRVGAANRIDTTAAAITPAQNTAEPQERKSVDDDGGNSSSTL